MAQPPTDVLQAAIKYGPTINHVAQQYVNPLTGRRLTGAQLLLKLAKGENGWDDKGVSNANARGYTQFIPSTRQEYIQKYGVDPWKNADSAFHATAIYLKNSGDIASYNPGMASYTNYILHQNIGRIPGVTIHGQGQPQSAPSTVASPNATAPATTNGSSGGLSAGAVDPATIVSLLGQSAQPVAPAPTAIAAPSFSAARYLQSSAMPLSATQSSQATTDNSLATKLAAVGALVSPASLASGAPAGSSPSAQPPTGSPGRTLLVGDSLGVGTAPLLKQLGLKVDANAKIGRPSDRGVQVLGNLLRGRQYSNIVFDLGTNDGSAQELRDSLRKALALAPNANFYVPTLNGPGAVRKNAVLHEVAANHQNVHLVPWHSVSQTQNLTDGIHGGYDRRASLLASYLGYRPSSSAASPAAGRPTFAGASRQGLQPVLTSFLGALAGRTPITVTTGEVGHTTNVAGTNRRSDHSTGNAADLGINANGGVNGGDRIATNALILGGMSPASARKAARAGGLWDLYPKAGPWKGRRVQIIWKTDGPGIGNHYDHVHVGIR